MRAVDFFSGAGGVTCGFLQAEIDVLAGIDNEISCRDTYIINNNGINQHGISFICEDISTYQPQDLEDELGIHPYEDEMIFVGCSPCQYYTNMKTTKEKSKESRTLLEEFRRFVDYFRPGYIFIENVPGLKNNPESPLGQFQLFLQDNGYSFDENVVNAKYFGVPQNRRRYILIASRLTTPENPIQIPEQDRINVRTVRDAIGNTNLFPPIQAGVMDRSDFQHSTAKITPINLNRLANTPLDGGDRTAWANNEKLQLNCYINHDGHTDVYGRMAWDRPSPTITTKFCSISNGRYGHPEQLRAISLREGATLQSFPRNYIFYSRGQGSIAKMIGNAVPPLLAKSIGETINAHFNRWQNLRQAQGL